MVVSNKVGAIERIDRQIGHGTALAGGLRLRAGKRCEISTESQRVPAVQIVVGPKIVLVAALQARRRKHVVLNVGYSIQPTARGVLADIDILARGSSERTDI